MKCAGVIHFTLLSVNAIFVLTLLISIVFHSLFIFHFCNLATSLSTVSLIDEPKFHPKMVSLPFEIFFIFLQAYV